MADHSSASRLDFSAFQISNEWSMMKAHIEAMIQDKVNDIVDAGKHGDSAKVMSTAGEIGALKEVITLPEFLHSYTYAKKGAE